MSWQREHIARFKQKCLDYLESGGCTSCGYSRCTAVLDFHHRDPKTKSFNLSDPYYRHKELWEKVCSELDKCDVLCANCHREHHYGFDADLVAYEDSGKMS